MTRFRRKLKNLSIDYYRRGYPHKQLYYSAAITGNGKCVMCKKEIPKGTPVFWYWDKFKKYKKKNPLTPKNQKREATDLNIKRKICFRCIDNHVFSHLLERYQDELEKIKRMRRGFRRSLKGKKCKRAIENSIALDELEREDFTKNFDYNKFHG
jgi:hypothetical protein